MIGRHGSDASHRPSSITIASLLPVCHSIRVNSIPKKRKMKKGLDGEAGEKAGEKDLKSECRGSERPRPEKRQPIMHHRSPQQWPLLTIAEQHL